MQRPMRESVRQPLATYAAASARTLGNRIRRATPVLHHTSFCPYPAKSSGDLEELAGRSGHSAIARFALRRSGFRWRAVDRRVVTHGSRLTFESPTPRHLEGP